ncbi:MAG: periplasmic heavy metal sensor [Alphaproteobacteria bacterium]|nr:periplasmic heavy metal sensor [Alphaproteobacteria bacterium]
MTEQTNPAPKRGFGFAALIAATLIGAVGGGFATSAVGHGMGHGHGGWGAHGMHGKMDPARAQEHAERMVGHLSWAIDATADQKQKLTTIATAMIKDLLPVHEKMDAARQRAIQLLQQPQTDRAALETLRAEQIATADEASKRLAQGLADAADVLTPPQRAKLAQHWRF